MGVFTRGETFCVKPKVRDRALLIGRLIDSPEWSMPIALLSELINQ